MDGKRMSAELKGILAVGIALGGLTLTLLDRMDNRLDRIEDQMGEVRTELGEVRTELRKLGERVARIEGMIERPSPLATGKHNTSGGK